MQNLRKLLLTVLPLIAACSGIEVRTNPDAVTHFSNYQTYFWAKLPATPANPANADRIVAEIDGQMSAKGWKKVVDEQGDLAIVAYVTTREQERIDNTMYRNMGYGWFGPSWNSDWVGSGMSTGTTVYSAGTLIVDVFDARANEGKQIASVRHAHAEGILAKGAQENERRIKEAVREMFDDFPYSGGMSPPR